MIGAILKIMKDLEKEYYKAIATMYKTGHGKVTGTKTVSSEQLAVEDGCILTLLTDIFIRNQI